MYIVRVPETVAIYVTSCNNGGVSGCWFAGLLVCSLRCNRAYKPTNLYVCTTKIRGGIYVRNHVPRTFPKFIYFGTNGRHKFLKTFVFPIDDEKIMPNE